VAFGMMKLDIPGDKARFLSVKVTADKSSSVAAVFSSFLVAAVVIISFIFSLFVAYSFGLMLLYFSDLSNKKHYFPPSFPSTF
jgi:hypothetical protein